MARLSFFMKPGEVPAAYFQLFQVHGSPAGHCHVNKYRLFLIGSGRKKDWNLPPNDGADFPGDTK